MCRSCRGDYCFFILTTIKHLLRVGLTPHQPPGYGFQVPHVGAAAPAQNLY